MNEWTRIFLVGLVVLLTHTLEGITGFGCTVLALPFVAMLLGIKTAVPVLCVLGWLMALYIVLRSYRAIRWHEFGFIVLHVGLGLPVGILLFDVLPAKTLCLLLGIFMVGVSAHGFAKTLRRRTETAVGKNRLMQFFLFCGGVIHGAFSSGGPFVVIYAARALPEKALFRVTLCLLWTTLNTILMLHWTWTGTVWTPEAGRVILWAVPFLACGMLLGDFLHHKVDEYYFKLSVYAVLGASGAAMLISNL